MIKLSKILAKSKGTEEKKSVPKSTVAAAKKLAPVSKTPLTVKKLVIKPRDEEKTSSRKTAPGRTKMIVELLLEKKHTDKAIFDKVTKVHGETFPIGRIQSVRRCLNNKTAFYAEEKKGRTPVDKIKDKE